MKSVVIQQPEQLAIEERPIPQPQAGEVRIRVCSAGDLRLRRTYFSWA